MADDRHPWPAGFFLVAMPSGVVRRAGYVWKGLGLYRVSAGSPKGRRKPRWSLTHLGSGHLVAYIDGDVRTVFPVATDIAEAGDWTFDSLTGWKNQFPNIHERWAELKAKHGRVLVRIGGGGPDESIARQIASTAA